MKNSERTADKLSRICKSFLICCLIGTVLYTLSSASPLGCITIRKGGVCADGMFSRMAERSGFMGHIPLIISAILITVFLIWTVSRTFIKPAKEEFYHE